jgi:ABC-type multidrug transport system ATPase subunit
MIQLQHVRKSFKGQLAVQNLNLQAQEGEILGANGAGKSTTINMLLGFLLPDSGTVSIGERKQPSRLRKSVNLTVISPKMLTCIRIYQDLKIWIISASWQA